MLSKGEKMTEKKTKKTAPKRTKALSEDELLALIVDLLDKGKAENILTIPLMGKTSLADYLVIASGRSTRQVLALASTLYEKLKDIKLKPRIEGKEGSGEWVIVDVGDIIVHLFYPETRSFYGIEKLWGEKTPPLD